MDHLYDFQEQLIQLYLGDMTGQPENIVLQAPTGSGKTLGAIFPAIEGFRKNKIGEIQHPQKINYGIPMRCLANGFEAEYASYDKEFLDWDRAWNARIQTGERPENRQFEGQLIFATVDQILASFLNIPYGLPGGRDNINAGAFIGSYLVFDEFHLYPSRQMMLTVLAMLTMLKDVSRFTLMTATFSTELLQAIATQLGAVAVADGLQLPNAEIVTFNDIDHLSAQHRIWETHEHDNEPLNANHVLDALDEYDTVLCICNRVGRSQEVYQPLREALENRNDVETMLLHSQFYSANRQKKEKDARKWLGKNRLKDKKYVIVATQVVEVGLDISADILLTECAPAASLIQRAGRCARWGGDGIVRVFQPPADREGSDKPNYAPYIDDSLEDVCRKTWEALTSSDFNGQRLDYILEQELIDETHADHDSEHLIDGLAAKIDTRIEEIIDCIQKQDAGMRRHLIRENSNANLFIMANPNADDRMTTSPYRYESFSVSRGRLSYEFEHMNPDAPFSLMGAKPDDIEDNEGENQTVYKWGNIKQQDEIFHFWEFVAHPQAVAYDSNFGLRWRNPEAIAATESPPKPTQNTDFHGYHADTYVEHITGLHDAYTKVDHAKEYYLSLRNEYQYALLTMAKRLDKNITRETLDFYVQLTLLLHDVGKLNDRWQQWAQKRHTLYVKKVSSTRLPADGTPLAHTAKGFSVFATPADAKAYEEAFKELPIQSRGNHSVESATAVAPLIWELTNRSKTWFSVIITAICRHHTPKAETAHEFTMVDTGLEVIRSTFDNYGLSEHTSLVVSLLETQFDEESSLVRRGLSHAAIKTGDYDTALMYFLFVRILRLADQRSSEFAHDMPNRRD